MNSTIRRASLVFLLVASACLCQTMQAETGPVLEAQTYAGITVTGTVSATYTIEATTNLAVTNGWAALTNVVLPASPWVYVDYASPGLGMRFYRAVGTNSNTATNAPVGMVWIAPGTFTMGSPTSEVNRFSDEDQHTVTISQGFWMGKHELTQEEYQAVMGSNPSSFTGDLKRPVETVSWYDATNYCGKLTQQERAAGRLPAGYVYRLPTEAEWEYACRAGTTTATAYGISLGSAQANFDGNYPYNGAAQGPCLGTTTVVGSYAPNAWGLYDMHGNVWEWCLDWHGYYPTSSVTDPPGPANGSLRVLRGGYWNSNGKVCRSADRSRLWPDFSVDSTGFRPVLALDQLQERTGPVLEAQMYAGITVTGTVSATYTIEAATNLGVTNGWLALTNVDLPTNPWVYIDYASPGLGRRFYRASCMVTNTNSPFGMVWIAPGTFTMGSPATEVNRSTNEVQHAVTISQGFWMGKYELTQGEYQAVMGSNPSSFTGDLKRPVEQVSWNDATNYCGKLTQQEGAAGRLPAGYVYRLPTEAEWEYACRAGTTTATAYGNSLSSAQANFDGDYPYNGAAKGPDLEKTTVVGSYASNAWGLYDMHGNVWEWCLDWPGDYPSGSVTDPQGAPSGSDRVMRGGSWFGMSIECRSAYRAYYGPAYRARLIGFRPVLAPGQ